MRKPPFFHLERPDAAVNISERDNGALILESPYPLGEYKTHVIEYLIDAAKDHPDRTFLAQRGTDGEWVHLTYADALAKSERIAQWLLNRDYGPDKPVMILSDNTQEHALLMLGAMQAAAPVVPVSPAYSLMSKDHGKLKHICGMVNPALIFAQDAKTFAAALGALDLEEVDVVAVNHVAAVAETHDFSEMLNTNVTPAVEKSRQSLTADTVAKILFTSGSTGIPKGVPNPHRMLCSVQQMIDAISDNSDPDQPAVLLDWLPWHHTFGGNANFNGIMRGAGTMYIDAGRPVPGLFEITIQNLKEIAPTYFSCVPAAYAMLVDRLETDAQLSQNFFSKVRGLSYGGAALPQAVYDRMQALAIQYKKVRLHFSTGYGATETGALNTAVHWQTERMGLIGLPMPGMQIKLVPLGGKFAVWVKGPQVMPGYYKAPSLTDEVFDAEGFFCTGDAAFWVDPKDPKQGLAFAGRTTEDFKLTNGTWVHTGSLRVKVIAGLSPLVEDALITGHDREFIGALAWPSLPALRAICPDAPSDSTAAQLVIRPEVRDAIRVRLRRYNADHPGSSNQIRRLTLMADPPSIDLGEITDKRYVNQKTALEVRAHMVNSLYAETPSPDVLTG